MEKSFWDKFFKESDHTGRFLVVSNRTGVKYAVEPLDPRVRPETWGDVDIVTKKTTGNYGHKYKGSIKPEESLITADNGFKNITELEAGHSPEGYIEWKDAQYPDKAKTTTV